MKKIIKSLFVMLIGVFGYLVLPNSVFAEDIMVYKLNIHDFEMPEYNGNVADSKINEGNVHLCDYDGYVYYINEDAYPDIYSSWSYYDENGAIQVAGSKFDKKAMYILELTIDSNNKSNFIKFISNNNNTGSKYEGTLVINNSAPTMTYFSNINNNPSGSKKSTFKFYFDLREEVDIKNVNFDFLPIVNKFRDDISVSTNYGKLVPSTPDDFYYSINSAGTYDFMDNGDTYKENYSYITYYYFNPIYKYVTNDLRMDNMDYVTSSNVNGEKKDVFYKEAVNNFSPFESIAIKSKSYKSSYTVTFDNKGYGVKPDKQTVNVGTKATRPDDLTADKKIFAGWYIDSDCTEPYDFDNTVLKDITLYAKWINEYSYEFLNGDNQELEKGNIKEYVFRVDGEYSKFLSLKMGDVNFVKDEDYTVTEGSTIITFLKKGLDKLNKLGEGKYTIKVMYTNERMATGNLVIKKSEKNPGTGDNIILFVGVGLVSLAGIITSGKFLKKEQQI